ncbi:MAG: tryptophan--tRNA ligase [Oscillospiraceae bacterium]|nr:tryptophan--tRNA ligase [Oscillospiraceae bacterium]
MQENSTKKIIFSGIQPTGTFTLGNYIGAVSNWGKLQDEYRCIYSIVDMHAITVRQEPAELRKNTLAAYALLLACGIDLTKTILFVQSHVKAHAELNWVLNCSAQFGELTRMTQFKEKSEKHPEDINAGLFTYPVLQAADILAYNADLVPVGADQKQHLELARNIAQRFNHKYGDTFTLPEPYIPQTGAKIMSLQEPTQKMSKSDENPNAVISILDEPDVIIRKFKRAVTDSEACVRFAEGKDGINNLLTIYSVVSGKSVSEAEKEFDGKGYGDFKLAVGEAVSDKLKSVREDYARLIADKAYLTECCKKSALTASAVSQRIIDKVYRKVGYLTVK